VEADLEQQALRAACGLASDHGLSCEQPTVLHSRTNVLIHLRPAPLVARVMTGTVALHDDPRCWLEREVSADSGRRRTQSERCIAPRLWLRTTGRTGQVAPCAGESLPRVHGADARRM
jgi:hypothetical protein